MIDYFKSLFSSKPTVQPEANTPTQQPAAIESQTKVEDLKKISIVLVTNEKDMPSKVEKGSCGADICWGLLDCGIC
jgi:hypothetical protein